MDPKLLSAIGAAGAAGGDPIGVEDVFKTYVYTGTGSALTINNGIDLSGEGGMVWAKDRSDGQDQQIVDTVRGDDKYIFPNMTNAESTVEGNGSTVGRVNSFNNNGFTLQPTQYDGTWNKSGDDYVSWTFKKQKKFFTIKTYSGTGSTQTLTHDLGSIPGAIFVKRTDTAADWGVYHRGQNGGTSPEDYRLKLNSNTGQNNDTYWGDTAPTASAFTVGDAHSEVNASGGTYVAYLFAHEEAEFGPNSDQKIISCGSFTGNGSSTGPEITLPFSPAWVLVKSSDANESWYLQDSIRGSSTVLFPNRNDAESGGGMEMTSTGFKITTSSGGLNGNLQNHIYIAIAAETGKTSKVPENGSDVFAMDYGNGSTTIPAFDSGFPVDFGLQRTPTTATDWAAVTRLMGPKELNTNDTSAEASGSAYVWDSNVGYTAASWADSNMLSWMWKRHSGFDCIVYKGDGVAGKQIPHNLGPNNVPEMIWVKNRDETHSWIVYHKGLDGGTNPETHYLELHSSAAEADYPVWNDTAPTSEHFTVGSDGSVNETNDSHIAFLFSSVKGVSHCGSYDGSNSEQTITIPDGGFQPRFVIIKCSTAAEGWLVLDTTRGWGAGDDKGLRLDTADAQGTDPYGAPTSTGFTVVGNFNVINQSGKKYVYYAHA